MSNNRNLGNIATAITNATSGQVLTSQGNGVATFADAAGGVSTIGSLDFSPSAINETSTITTSSNMSNAPFISAFKEVPQIGVSTKGNWDVNSTASNYDILDEAPLSYSGITVTPSSATADGTFTLSSGSFAAGDVGKQVAGNGGLVTITSTAGAYSLTTAFTNTNTIAAGSWSLKGLNADSSAKLKINGITSTYNISSASYDSVNFSVSSQDGYPTGIAFNADGTKLFMTGRNNDYVYQYSLNPAYNLSTLSYDGNSARFNVSSQSATPHGLTFNANGTKMYIIDTSLDKIFQYSVSPAYSIANASYDSKEFSCASQDTSPLGAIFNNDGSKLFIAGNANDAVYQYSVTDYDISTASYDSVSLSVSSQDLVPTGLRFNGNGTKLFVVGATNDAVYQYNLPTPYSLINASYDNVSFSFGNQESTPRDVLFNNSGTKMYLVGSDGTRIYQYSAGQVIIPTSQYLVATTNSSGQIDTTAWNDLNSLTADETLNDGATYYAFSTDGRTTWKVQDSSGNLRSIARLNSSTWQYNSSSDATTNFTLPSSALAFATGTASSYSSKYTVQPISGATDAAVWDATMVPVGGVSGKGLVVADRDSNSNGRTIRYFTLATAYDLSSTLTEVDISSTNWNPSGALNYWGCMFNPDGTKFFVTGKAGNYADIRQYNLTTAYDLSTATLQSDHFNSTHGFGQHYNYAIAGVSDSKIYLCRTGFHNYLFSKNLTSSGDIDTSHTTLTQEANLPNDSLNNVKISSDGKRIFAHDHNTTNHYLYTLTTAFDFTSLDSSATITNTSVDGLTNNQTKLQYDEEGKYIVGANGSTNEVFLSPSSTFTAGNAFDHESWVNATNNNQQSALQQALGSQAVNRLTGTSLATYSDANLLATGNTFDLMIGLYIGSAGTSPTSDAITINYDASTQNKGAILGTDYDVEKLSDTQLKFTALTQKNMHFKVI